MHRFALLLFCSSLVGQAGSLIPSWDHPPHQQREGIFWRTHWYDREINQPRLGYTRRPRINAPDAVVDPRWGIRTETRENGLLLIRTEEDLFHIRGAELYTELWGGHPGTANKRVTLNGRRTYALPRSGTEALHCTYSYPIVPLQTDDLVNGINAVQWNLDTGTTFWGHAMLDNACLRFALTNSHPDLVAAQLSEFAVHVEAVYDRTQETWTMDLKGRSVDLDQIDHVDYQGWYRGYDDNGNRSREDWHGFTQKQMPMAFLGSSHQSPFRSHWNTRLIPAQKNVALRAIVSFKKHPKLQYLTAARTGLSIPDRSHSTVHLYQPSDLPESFWSRDNRAKHCTIQLDEPPSQIEEAELYVITWTGGPGDVTDYFTLNGTHFPVAEGHDHEIQFNRIPVPTALLKQGPNTIRLLSDTKHHGIEIIYPGPALMVRSRR